MFLVNLNVSGSAFKSIQKKAVMIKPMEVSLYIFLSSFNIYVQQILNQPA